MPGNIIHKEESFLNNLKLIIEKARALRIPLIYIQHGTKSTGLLEIGSHGWNIHHEILPLENDIIVYKGTPDSFKDTNLKAELDSRNIGNLILVGLQTEYCVDTTCRKAWSLGYNVTLIKDAHSTYDTSYLSAEQIIMHHNRILGDWFVTTKTTEEFIDSSLL
jgi:nicotinamidase-related amidase